MTPVFTFLKAEWNMGCVFLFSFSWHNPFCWLCFDLEKSDLWQKRALRWLLAHFEAVDEAADVRTGLQTSAQVGPDHPGPYLAPNSAEDVADASDDAMAVPDVLEAGKSSNDLAQTRADVADARADVLVGLSSLWRPQKL